MAKKWGSNQDIHIGDIFKCWSNDDWFWLYEVTALRGKTQVELHAIQSERFIDEGISEDSPLYWRRNLERPLPGQFVPEDQVTRFGFWRKGECIVITSRWALTWVLPKSSREERFRLQAVGPAWSRFGIWFEQALPEDWEPLDSDTIKRMEEEARTEQEEFRSRWSGKER